MRNLQDMLSSVSSARGSRQGRAAKRLAGLGALKQHGLIRHENDRTGIAAAMKELPGPFPKTNFPADDEIDSFFDYLENAFGMWWGRPDDPRDDEGESWADGDIFGLVETTVLAAATGAASTATVANLDYDEAILWLDTGHGLVETVTAASVNGMPFYFGEGTIYPAQELDIANRNRLDGGAEGLWLGRVKNTLSVSVFVATSPSDVTWRVYLEGKRDSSPGANQGTQAKAGRRFLKGLRGGRFGR